MHWERLSLYFVLAALPLYGVRFTIAGQPSHALELLILGTFAIHLIRHLFGMKPSLQLPLEANNFRLKALPWFVVTLAAAALVSLFSAPNFVAAFASLRHFYVEPLMVVWMLRRSFVGTDDVLRVLTALSVPVVPIAAVAILQHFDMYPIPAVYQVEDRSTSLYSYANAVGLYVAPMIAAAIAVLWYRFCVLQKSAKEFFETLDAVKIGYFASVAILGGFAIAYSQTEAAWLALGATLGIAGLVYARTRVVTLIAGVGGLLFLNTDYPLARRLLQKLLLWDFSGAVRRDMWTETIAFLREHWILGAGLAGYQTRIAPYHHNPLIEIFWFPHNVVLNVWVELGFLGILSFIGAATWYVSSAKKVGLQHWILTAPLLVVLIHGLFDVPFFKPDLAVMTATLVACASLFHRYETP